MTKPIIDIAKPLGIAVHDHIIVNKNGARDAEGVAADLIVECIYHLLTLHFRSQQKCEKLILRAGNSMINEMTQRLLGADLSMLSPGWLIDRLLDEIEKMSIAILPAPADGPARKEMRVAIHDPIIVSRTAAPR